MSLQGMQMDLIYEIRRKLKIRKKMKIQLEK